MAEKNLRQLESHFSFGENWSDYSQRIDENRIRQAVEDMQRLLPTPELRGKKFLDIGCGSGLHSLAALRLGAQEIVATDIDPQSVSTTQKVLEKFSPDKNFTVKVQSIFDWPSSQEGKFDVVYSWGVLHHTGDMYEAIRKATELVAPGGTLVLALYRKTKLCSFWKVEKRFYTVSPKWIKRLMDVVFSFFLLLDQTRRGHNPVRFVREYSKMRGMSFSHDVRDWLGGYPYESISPQEMHSFAESLGFKLLREQLSPSGLGVFGSGCDEFVFKRI